MRTPMLWLSNTRIGLRLGLGFGLMVLLVIVGAWTSISRLNALEASFTGIADQRLDALERQQELLANVAALEQAIDSAVVAVDDASAVRALRARIDGIHASHSALQGSVADAESASSQPSALQRSYAAFRASALKIADYLAKKDAVEAMDENIGGFATAKKAYTQALRQVRQTQRQQVQQERRDVVESNRTVRGFVMILSLISVAIGLAVAVRITRSVTRPLDTILHATEDLREGEGDLTFRLPAQASDFGRLSHSINGFLQKLHDIISAVAASAGHVRMAATDLNQGNADLARRTEQQAASLEETAAALDEITATVRKTAEGSKQANSVVATTRTDAEASGQVVRETVAAMAEIEKSSKQISQIIGVIDEIAFQTNLLALNAGVEAARAGDAGRGFAVVASEVRSLAQRSSEAAKEIKGLISASSQHVETGVELVGDAGKALQKIVVKVNEISGLVSEIAASAQEQATALAEVNTAINQMDQVTQQNAAMVEQSTAASHSLTQEADDLMNLVSRFRTGAEPAQGARGAPARAKPPSQPIAKQRERVARFASSGSAALKPDDDWQEF